jgi:CheY-like chemotaxis protein
VILLDFHLPDMCGATVLQLLKADPWTRDIPVVLFTAQDTDRRVLESLPVVDLVFKPFQPNELCATLRNAMQGMRRHRRPHRAQHANAHSGVQRATL